MITNQYGLDEEKPSKKMSSRPISREDLKNKIKALHELTAQRKRNFLVDELCEMGFKYTGIENTVQCDDCGLQLSNLTRDMKLFLIHAERQPTCPFIRSKMGSNAGSVQSIAEMETDNNSGVPINEDKPPMQTFTELQLLKEVRKRSFSHWPHPTTPSATQMIAAGFFHCNVGDRVICLYCKIICQQWTPNCDDPCEVHMVLSPKCAYVRANLLYNNSMELVPIVNEGSKGVATINDGTGLFDQLVSAEVSHFAYREIPKRYASFNTWTNDASPSVDDLVRAGFFYTGTRSVVTCFYCNGSLQNWGANDNPMIEHARWFPHCAYAKQLCGEREYRRIQQVNQRRKGTKIS